jgi:transposase
MNLQVLSASCVPSPARMINAQRLITMPGVGFLVALTFVAAVDAPERFRSSRAVGRTSD